MLWRYKRIHLTTGSEYGIILLPVQSGWWYRQILKTPNHTLSEYGTRNSRNFAEIGEYIHVYTGVCTYLITCNY